MVRGQPFIVILLRTHQPDEQPVITSRGDFKDLCSSPQKIQAGRSIKLVQPVGEASQT